VSFGICSHKLRVNKTGDVALAPATLCDNTNSGYSRCSKWSANHPGELARWVMTTHPTSVNAGSADGDQAVNAADHVPDLRSGPDKRATGRDDSGRAGCVDHRGTPSPQIGENQMRRRQFQRSPAEYGSGVARTPSLLRRTRDVAAFARRSAHRKEDAAIDTVPAIEDQLRTLWPICSAQRVSTGIVCGAPAVAVAEMHAIDGCETGAHQRQEPDSRVCGEEGFSARGAATCRSRRRRSDRRRTSCRSRRRTGRRASSSIRRRSGRRCSSSPSCTC